MTKEIKFPISEYEAVIRKVPCDNGVQIPYEYIEVNIKSDNRDQFEESLRNMYAYLQDMFGKPEYKPSETKQIIIKPTSSIEAPNSTLICECGSALQDYRQAKKDGKVSDKYPDFKCSQQNCGKVAYLNPQGGLKFWNKKS
jgi:hypothetical protein